MRATSSKTLQLRCGFPIIPEGVLLAVLGRHNPPGTSDDGTGLVLIEKLLHGTLPGGKAPADVRPGNGPGTAFNLAPATCAVYGPLISPTDGDGPLVWKTTRRSMPTTTHPAALLVGTIEGGRAATLGGCYTTGYIVDLSMISVQFVASALVSIADGSARRGCHGWVWPSVLRERRCVRCAVEGRLL